MKKQQQEEKNSFWQRYKILIIGVLGTLLLIGSLSVQNVVVAFRAEGGEQYAVKLDYSAFGMCLRCYPAGDNAASIVEKAVFFCSGRESSVEKAVKGLQEIAGTTEGEIYLEANGLLGNNEKTTEDLVNFLKDQGYQAAAVEDLPDAE